MGLTLALLALAQLITSLAGALAVWGAAGGSGMVLGSLLGGMLTQAFGWQAVFYVNVPLAVIAIALAFPLLAADAMPRTGHRFDLPGTLSATIGTTRMSTRFGTPATLITSLALAASGTAVLGLTMSAHATYSTVLPGLIILSLGQGAAYTTMFAAATTGVPAEQQGIASGIASTGQQVGGAIGLAIAIANSGTEGSTGQALRTATTTGLRTAVFVIVAGIAAAALLAANFTLRGSSAKGSVPGGRGGAPALSPVAGSVRSRAGG